jgi:hypothetical protein
MKGIMLTEEFSRKIFVRKKDEAPGGWAKLNEELYDSHSL